MSVQYTSIFHGCKMIMSHDFFCIVLIFAKNFDCGYTLSSVYTITHWLSVRLPYGDILHSLTYAGIR